MTKVFVYGSLKRGFGNHDVMEQAGGEFLGEYTLDNATMFSFGAFPVISFDEESKGVKGEVYEVSDLGPIDTLEGYPHMYDRKTITTEYGPAYVYHMSPARTLRLPMVESGVW